MRKQTMDLKTKPTTPMLMIRPEFHLVLSLTVPVFRNTIAEVQLRRTSLISIVDYISQTYTA